jgi:hypothetical protein
MGRTVSLVRLEFEPDQDEHSQLQDLDGETHAE